MLTGKEVVQNSSSETTQLHNTLYLFIYMLLNDKSALQYRLVSRVARNYPDSMNRLLMH